MLEFAVWLGSIVMVDLATWTGSLAAIIAAVVAGYVSRQLRQRERRQAIADINTDFTTGEVAEARDVVGTALYAPDGLSLVGPRELINAYFKLHWAFQRAQNTYRVFGLRPTTSASIGGQHKDFLSWNFREVVQNIVIVHNKFGSELHIADEDAWVWFESQLKASHEELHAEFFGPSSLLSHRLLN